MSGLGISVKRWWCRECQVVLKPTQVSSAGKCCGCLAPVREIDWEMLEIYFVYRDKFDTAIREAQIISVQHSKLYEQFAALRQELEQL